MFVTKQQALATVKIHLRIHFMCQARTIDA